MTHLSCKYNHLILITCTPWSLWTLFLIPTADWLYVLLLFPENSFNASSLLHISIYQFWGTELLWHLSHWHCPPLSTPPLPMPCLVYPKLKTSVSGCPCLLLPVLFPTIHHNFLHAKHLLDSSQAFPTNPLSHTSLQPFWFQFLPPNSATPWAYPQSGKKEVEPQPMAVSSTFHHPASSLPMLLKNTTHFV